MTDRIVPEVGIHQDVSFEEYLKWDAINQSSLKVALQSPRKYKFGKPIEETDAMRLGTLVHVTQLEPTKVHERYAVLPPFEKGMFDDDGQWIDEPCTKADGKKSSEPRRTAMYRDRVDWWMRGKEGVEIVGREWFESADGMVRSMAEDALCRDCLVEGTKEVSIVWECMGFLCKARIDNWQPKRRICDLKSTADIFDFAWSLKKWGYHIQAAFYLDGIKALTGDDYQFWIVACEKVAPFERGAAPVDGKSVRLGRIQYKSALATIRRCEDSGEWPGFQSPAAWELPTSPTILNVKGEDIAL